MWYRVRSGALVCSFGDLGLCDTVAWETEKLVEGFGGSCHVGYLVHIDMPNATARPPVRKRMGGDGGFSVVRYLNVRCLAVVDGYLVWT